MYIYIYIHIMYIMCMYVYIYIYVHDGWWMIIAVLSDMMWIHPKIFNISMGDPPKGCKSLVQWESDG